MTQVAADDPDELLLPKQAARLAGVNVSSLSRYVKAGKLVAVRTPGGHYRYRRADIVALHTPVIHQ